MKFYKYIIDCIISWFLNKSLYNSYIKLMERNIISIYKLLLFFSTVMISKAKVQTIPDPLSARPFTHNYNKDMVWIYSKDIPCMY